MGSFSSTPYANNSYIQDEFQYYSSQAYRSPTQRQFSSTRIGAILGHRASHVTHSWVYDGDPRSQIALNSRNRESENTMDSRYPSKDGVLDRSAMLDINEVQIHGKKQIQVVTSGTRTVVQTVPAVEGKTTENGPTTSKRPLSLVVARKTMAEISIPGMKAIFGFRAHLSRKAIWSIILVICTAISVVQVQDRVLYYLSTPISVNVRVTRNESLKFPVLSLCNKNENNVSAMNILKQEKAEALRNNGVEVTDKEIANWDLPDLVGVRGFNAKDLWDFTAHDLNKMILEVQ